ncbi:helix-turn-helix domain-containing protein [Sandaracinus amylolyticus]|uniref:helix-turn-helix domain-containing protein n=1 Tax=Sandaracinus amylolyticus TaxID=927083 RepID=UPI001F297A49|nr:helix-turn-helix transcriptional regulator [Sandaracinus amylolyticus]UJR79584.1 PTS system nitrogen regulatory IIA component [Sandaracinus amylolyticus]
MSHVGTTLRRLRLESGLSLRDLARRLGVSSAYLSRVEHGLDAAPTPERLEAIAAELGLPASLLIEVGHRVSPFVERYLEQEPQAAALFFEIASRGLGAEELAEVQRYVARRWPKRVALEDDAGTHRLAPLLDDERVVLGLHCDALEDAYEIASARLASLPRMPDASVLAEAFRAREEEVGAGVGAGVGVLCAAVAGAQPCAAVVLLARPLANDAPDADPLSVLVLLAAPSRGRDPMLRVAHVARLAGRGMASALREVERSEAVLQRIALLELVE